MSRSALRIVRLAAIGLLCLLIAFVLWRGVRVGWLTWQGVQAAQQLQADSSMNSGPGGQAGESVTWSEQLPRLRADLQLLS